MSAKDLDLDRDWENDKARDEQHQEEQRRLSDQRRAADDLPPLPDGEEG